MRGLVLVERGRRKSRSSTGSGIARQRSFFCRHAYVAVTSAAQEGLSGSLDSLTYAAKMAWARSPHASRYAPANVEQSYSPSFEKLLALFLTAFIAILGPFHPIISSFLSSSSSVAMKNFSSSC